MLPSTGQSREVLPVFLCFRKCTVISAKAIIFSYCQLVVFNDHNILVFFCEFMMLKCHLITTFVFYREEN